jgi:hypothetical protein
MGRQKVAGRSSTSVAWFDPDTFADSLGLWQKIAVSVVAIGGAIGAIWSWGAGFSRWLASKFRRAKPAAPSVKPTIDRPLRFVVDELKSRRRDSP